MDAFIRPYVWKPLTANYLQEESIQFNETLFFKG